MLYNSDDFVCYYGGSHPKAGGDWGPESAYYAITAKLSKEWAGDADWLAVQIFNNDGWIVMGIYDTEKQAENALELLYGAFEKRLEAFELPGKPVRLDDIMPEVNNDGE